MAIKIQAAQRLKASRKKRKQVRARNEVSQTTIDLVAPLIFKKAREVMNVTQREKVDMRMPFPFTPVWRTDIKDNMMYVSANAETYQLWCFVFVNSNHHGDAPTKAFVQDIRFGPNMPVRAAITEAYDEVKVRIHRWLAQTIGA